MGCGCWSGGMWGTPLSPAGPSLPCAAPAWAPGRAVLLWHREREGLANRIRSCGTSQQPLVLLHAHSCALCSGKPCWKCSGQCLFPTHTWALWPQPCGSSKLSHSKCQGWMGLSLLPLALPWGSPTSSHHSEAFGCSWLSPACCFHHSFWMVRPQQPQLSLGRPGELSGSSNPGSSCLCLQIHFSLIIRLGHFPPLGSSGC